ncbi:uncharacterized protein LOC142177431 [Nicotiana tabacum]|uniref:Uncharacterized protein LOC142177431 n=1 Tax=Nicotiana tabacum TaxID=4097 RepID=A0AC58TXY6_TOBAC
MGYIALATTTSDVAASIFPGGRIAHSHFKISIDIDENATCNITKQSALAGLIRDAKLIVWDEVSMTNKRMLEVFDLLLKDFMNTKVLFGGKVVVLGGDFRQTLPVVRNGNKKDFINESLLYSRIWNELEKLRLLENMRAKTDPAFCDYLIRIENGQERVNSTNKIEFPNSLVIPFTTERESLDKLIRETYPNLNLFYSNSLCTDSRVILTTKNDFANEINDMLIDQFHGKVRTFIGIDETTELNNQTQFEDLLHSLNPTNMPPYKLSLKENCPMMLLQNLNPYEGSKLGSLPCVQRKRNLLDTYTQKMQEREEQLFVHLTPYKHSHNEHVHGIRNHHFHDDYLLKILLQLPFLKIQASCNMINDENLENSSKGDPLSKGASPEPLEESQWISCWNFHMKNLLTPATTSAQHTRLVKLVLHLFTMQS